VDPGQNGGVPVESWSGNETEVQARLSDVAADVKVRTTNGPLTVRLGGARWEGVGLGYSADLETGTTNGPIAIRKG
jgi:hypothetical protein